MRTVRWLIWELPMKSREKMTIGTVEKTRHCPQLSNTSHGHTAQPTGALSLQEKEAAHRQD